MQARMNDEPRDSAFTVVFPFYPQHDVSLSLRLLENALHKALRQTPHVWVVEDGVRLVEDADGINLLSLPTTSGKVAASRHGIARALERENAQWFAIYDWDEEQEIEDGSVLLELLTTRRSHAVIGNRYAHFGPTEILAHRVVLNYIQELIATRLGSRVTDLPSGIVACDRAFGQLFADVSKGRGDAVGFDWIALACIDRKVLSNAPVHARMRADRTHGEKLARGFAILLHYEAELRQRGRGDVAEFCRYLVTALRSGHDTIEIPVDKLEGGKPCAAVRHGADYSFIF
jgi:hypothetical protein